MNTATHLTLAERYQIEIMRRYATGHNKIARSLGRSRSTIDREVERNLSPNGRYNAVQANAFARARLRSRARANALGVRFTARVNFSPGPTAAGGFVVGRQTPPPVPGAVLGRGCDAAPEQTRAASTPQSGLGFITISHSTTLRSRSRDACVWTAVNCASRTRRSMPISTPTSVPVVICGANFPAKSCANGATARAGPAAT